MQESKLFLVFEYLSMDLKKYVDSFESGKYLDKMLVKSYCYQVSFIDFFPFTEAFQEDFIFWFLGSLF